MLLSQLQLRPQRLSEAQLSLEPRVALHCLSLLLTSSRSLSQSPPLGSTQHYQERSGTPGRQGHAPREAAPVGSVVLPLWVLTQSGLER